MDTDMTSINLSDYEVHSAEYPVFSFRNILSPELFDDLNKEFPPMSSMSERRGELFAQCHSSDAKGQFHQLCTEFESIRALREMIDSEAFVFRLTKFLVSNRRSWGSYGSFLRLLVRTRLNRLTATVSLHCGVRGYGLTPHTDKADKFAALIIYLGSGDFNAVATGGTAFYTPTENHLAKRFLRKLTGMNQRGWRFVPFRFLPLVSVGLPRVYSKGESSDQGAKALMAEFHHAHKRFFVSEFVPNSGALFFKDQLTWHEVDLANFPPHELRRSILVNLYCVPALPKRIFHRFRDAIRPSVP